MGTAIVDETGWMDAQGKDRDPSRSGVQNSASVVEIVQNTGPSGPLVAAKTSSSFYSCDLRLGYNLRRVPSPRSLNGRMDTGRKP